MTSAKYPEEGHLALAAIWEELQGFQRQQLARHGVKSLPHYSGTCAQLGLIFMYYNRPNPVPKDLVGAWVQKVAMAIYEKKCAADIQSIRQWPRDEGWPIYSADKKHLDVYGKPLPKSHYAFYGTNPMSEWVNRRTRELGRAAAGDWEALIEAYGCRCGVCGKGGRNQRSGELLVKLEQGHMDPRESLDIDNMIPICESCNKWQLDRFVVDEDGRIKTILPKEANKSLFKSLDLRERRIIRSWLD